MIAIPIAAFALLALGAAAFAVGPLLRQKDAKGRWILASAILVFLLGIITLGLGWMLFSVLVPAVAVIYIWNTLGGRDQATLGMKAMGIRLDRLDGTPIDGMTAVVHSVLFWAGNVILTPLVLLVTLFSDRKRTLHDLLLGTVVSRTDR